MAETIMKETTEEQKNNTTENVVTPFEKNTGNENATKETEEKTSAAENSDSVKTDSMKNDSVNANSVNANSANAGTTNADTANADTINADTTGSAHYRTIDDPSDKFFQRSVDSFPHQRRGSDGISPVRTASHGTFTTGKRETRKTHFHTGSAFTFTCRCHCSYLSFKRQSDNPFKHPLYCRHYWRFLDHEESKR